MHVSGKSDAKVPVSPVSHRSEVQRDREERREAIGTSPPKVSSEASPKCLVKRLQCRRWGLTKGRVNGREQLATRARMR